MIPKKPSRDEEIRAVFARSLKAIHFAFVIGYRLTEEEAEQGGETLHDWFLRLNHRPGAGSQTAAKLGDTYLLMVGACQLAQEYQLWKLDGAPCSDEELKEILERDPRELAFDLMARLVQEPR